jgi:CHAT domain-containing protein
MVGERLVPDSSWLSRWRGVSVIIWAHWRNLGRDHLYRNVRILALLLTLLILSGQGSQSRYSASLLAQSEIHAQIAELVGGRRFTEGRLTGGYPHADWQPDKQAPIKGSSKQLVRLRHLLSPAKRPSSDEWSGRATLYLLDGKIGAAISSLHQAAAREPANPALLSDLAALYIESARRTARPTDWVRSLELSNRALTLNPRLREALFNRALALQHLTLLKQAQFAWTSYLQMESDPGWREEALGRWRDIGQSLETGAWAGMREELEKALLREDRRRLAQIVAEYPRRTRILFESEFLPAWAEAVANKNSVEQARALLRMKLLADALVATLDDRLAQDVVLYIEAPRRTAPARARFAATVRMLQRGRQLYDQASYGESRKVLGNALAALESAQNPLSIKARANLAYATHYCGLFNEALQLLESIEQAARQPSYRSLQGEALWMKGLTFLALRRPFEAQDAYSQALRLFEELGDRENVAGLENLIAELLDFQGASADAWIHRYRTFRSIEHVRDPQRLYQVYTVAAIAAADQGFLRAALELEREAFLNAADARNPVAIATSRRLLATYHQKLKRKKAALRNLEWAWLAIQEVAPGATRERLRVDSLALEAQLTDDSGKALTLLSEAIERAGEVKYLDNLIHLYASRAEVHKTLGEFAETAADLENAIALVEEWRGRIATWSYRGEFFDREREVFDGMIDLQISKLGRTDRAWRYVEQLKGRTLREMLANRNLESRDLTSRPEELVGTLSDQTSVVTFKFVRRRLCSWVLSESGLHFGRCVPTERINRQIRALRQALQQNRERDAEEVGRELYRHLFAPLKLYLAANLVVVPDGELHGVPFAFLVDDEKGKHLAELHSITVTPSAGFYLSTVRGAKPAEKRLVLAIGGVVDEGRFPNLPYLKASLAEAEEVATLDPEGRLLTGDQATKEAVLRELPHAGAVHFATHAVTNSQSPAWSFLLLSGSTAGGGAPFFAWEIKQLDLRNLRLVVLPACGTGTGAQWRIEGIESLDEAFLFAGAHSVVSTLWSVDDDAVTEFVIKLHKWVKGGVRPSEALRIVQKEYIKRRGSSATWAAFQVRG